MENYQHYNIGELRELHAQLSGKISRYHSYQLNLKIALNSAYGALG
jgi:hypothetical protein